MSYNNRNNRRGNQVDNDDYEKEYYDEPEPDQPRFRSDRVREQTDSERRNTTCCMLCWCVLCVALAIALCVVFTNIYDEKRMEYERAQLYDSESPTASPTRIRLQDPKGVVDNVCSIEALSTDKDRCEEACIGFDCCDPYLPTRQTCFHSERQNCLNHARCHVLNLRKQPPPRNLYNICSEQSVIDDPTACSLACAAAECCWSEETSCAASDFFACVDYAPCQNLFRSNDSLRVKVPDQDIFDVCVRNGSAQCESMCREADCCWSGSTTCKQDNFFTCLLYNQCKGDIVIPFAGTSSVEPPTEDITQTCGFLSNSDVSTCEQACQPGLCCNSFSSSCFDRDPLTCLEYDACKVL